MARVRVQSSAHELRKEQKPITFSATNARGSVGTLVLSKGGLRWYPGKRSKRHYFMSWEQLNKKLPLATKLRS